MSTPPRAAQILAQIRTCARAFAHGTRVAPVLVMFALLAAFALQTTPPPPTTHHFVLHAGGHTTFKVHNAHLRRWSISRGGVVSLSDIRSTKTDTTVRLNATSPGSTSILVGCDKGGEEVWLVDVM